MYSSDSKVHDKDIYEMIDHFKVFNEEEVSLDRKITNKSLLDKCKNSHLLHSCQV